MFLLKGVANNVARQPTNQWNLNFAEHEISLIFVCCAWLAVYLRGRMSMKWKTNRMSKAQANQLEKVRVDEKIEEQEQIIKNDMKATLRASWNESLEEASERRRLKGKLEESKQEIRLANKALLEVRRAQLRKLLQAEAKQIEQELYQLDLTFYKDRL